MYTTKKTIRLTNVFAKLDCSPMRQDQQHAIKWLLPSRSLPPPSPLRVVPIEPDVNVRYYPCFKGYKVLEWHTCNRVWKENVDIGTHSSSRDATIGVRKTQSHQALEDRFSMY